MQPIIKTLAITGLFSFATFYANAQWGKQLDNAIGTYKNNNTNNNRNNNNDGRNNDGRNNNNNGTDNGRNNNSPGNSRGSNLNLGANLGSGDIVNGLREALSVGAKNAGARLHVANGFFGNSLIKVVMPPEAQKVESALRNIGMGSTVDDAILSMNRAAEDAAGEAVPIFVNAVMSMNIQDGLNILRGGNGAATNYLKQKTTAALTEAFRPVISKSLDKVGATSLWNTVFSTYNKLPLTRNKINPDLVAYVTERALSGLFITIAEEENKIRTNPAARVTSILQKVFGN